MRAVARGGAAARRGRRSSGGACPPSTARRRRAARSRAKTASTSASRIRPGWRYDVVLDIGGNRSLTQLRRLLAPRGTLVFVGGEAGGRWLGGTGRWLLATLLSPFVRQRLCVQVSKEVPPDLEHLAGLVTSGAIAAVLDRTYPLAEVPKAIAYLEDGHVRGKVVITV